MNNNTWMSMMMAQYQPYHGDDDWDEPEENDDDKKKDNNADNPPPSQKPPAKVVYDFNNCRMCKTETTIQPRAANHSYNGLMFDMKCIGFEDIEILGFYIGGQLGTVRIFSSDLSWRVAGCQKKEGWKLVAEENVPIAERKDWKSAYEIQLKDKVLMKSGTTLGWYIHCEIRNDRGLLYQSYSNYDKEILNDGRLILYPGIAHTSFKPFDERHGWWRSVRGLSGAIVYRSVRKVWNYKIHSTFPQKYKLAIYTVLLCTKRKECALFYKMPMELVFDILEFTDWRWWDTEYLLSPLHFQEDWKSNDKYEEIDFDEYNW